MKYFKTLLFALIVLSITGMANAGWESLGRYYADENYTTLHTSFSGEDFSGTGFDHECINEPDPDGYFYVAFHQRFMNRNWYNGITLQHWPHPASYHTFSGELVSDNGLAGCKDKYLEDDIVPLRYTCLACDGTDVKVTFKSTRIYVGYPADQYELKLKLKCLNPRCGSSFIKIDTVEVVEPK